MRILIGIVSLILLSSIIVVAKQPDNVPPDIRKVTFVHYIKSSVTKPTWDDTEDDFKLISGGVKWSHTISYEVNPAGSGLAPGVVKSALEASSETWDVETGFELFAPPSITANTSVGYDGKNRVVWEALDPGVIAVTHLWYDPATKEIVEFDTVFNINYNWGILDPENPDTTKMDLQNIATHEFGHNGLGDLRPPKDWALTMYAYSDLGETHKRTLGTGDILGIQTLYGE
ncbi:MAG: matrixin family metalloprotease [Candidatus Hydrothermarchaeota archaeon]